MVNRWMVMYCADTHTARNASLKLSAMKWNWLMTPVSLSCECPVLFSLCGLLFSSHTCVMKWWSLVDCGFHERHWCYMMLMNTRKCEKCFFDVVEVCFFCTRKVRSPADLHLCHPSVPPLEFWTWNDHCILRWSFLFWTWGFTCPFLYCMSHGQFSSMICFSFCQCYDILTSFAAFLPAFFSWASAVKIFNSEGIISHLHDLIQLGYRF